jgi:hypothetical protein
LDVTINIEDLIELLKTNNILGHKVQLVDVIQIIEKYYCPDYTLKTKISDEKFNAYL